MEGAFAARVSICLPVRPVFLWPEWTTCTSCHPPLWVLRITAQRSSDGQLSPRAWTFSSNLASSLLSLLPPVSAPGSEATPQEESYNIVNLRYNASSISYWFARRGHVLGASNSFVLLGALPTDLTSPPPPHPFFCKPDGCSNLHWHGCWHTGPDRRLRLCVLSGGIGHPVGWCSSNLRGVWCSLAAANVRVVPPFADHLPHAFVGPAVAKCGHA